MQHYIVWIRQSGNAIFSPAKKMPKRQFHNLPSTQLPKGGNRMVRGWDVLTFSFELRDKIWQNRILGVLRLAVKDRFVSSLDYLRLCLFFIFFVFVFSSTDWWIHCAMIPSLDEMCVCRLFAHFTTLWHICNLSPALFSRESCLYHWKFNQYLVATTWTISTRHLGIIV